MIRNETTIRLRYVETDAMGFAHHANYLSWFEMARIEMMDSLNLSYKALEGDGYFLPVLGASLTFKKPAYFDDVLKVVSVVHGKPSIRIKFEYDVFREETLLATGTTDHAFINKDGQPVRPPKTFVETFKAAMTAQEPPSS